MIFNICVNSKAYLIGSSALLLFLLCSLQLDAQIEKTLRKEFGKNEGVRGVETVYIETNLRDTIRNGIYALSTFQQIKSESRIVQSKLLGQYYEDKKNGPWRYLYEDYSMLVDSIVNRKPKVHLDGNVRTLEFNFNKGEPDSIWMAKLDSIRMDTLFKTNVISTMDWDTFSFSFVDKTVPRLKTVDGHITKEGFLNGSWKVEYDDDGLKFEETREYIHGFLIGYSVKELSSGILIDEEAFNEVFTLVELTNSDSSLTAPSDFVIDTFLIEDINKYVLASSRQMDFNIADEWIKTAHQFMFQPYIPGGKKVDIGGKDFFRTRMFRRVLKTEQIDSLDRLQNISLPDLRNNIHSLLDDKLLQKNRSQNDSISLIFTRLEVLKSQIDDMYIGLESMKSDSFNVLSVRQIHHIFGFNAVLKTLNDDEEVWLYAFSSPSTPRNSNIHFVTMYVAEAEALVAREEDKLTNIKQRILDLEMLLDLEGRIQQEVKDIRTIYSNYDSKSPAALEDTIGFKAIGKLGKYMNDEFVQRQLDARLSLIEMSNEVSVREENGLSTLDYIKSLEIQHELYNQLLDKAISMSSLYSNERGKRQNKHLYNKGEALWNLKLQKLLNEKDWTTFQSMLSQANIFLDAMQTIAKSDPQILKTLNKQARKAEDLQEVDQLILSRG